MQQKQLTLYDVADLVGAQIVLPEHTVSVGDDQLEQLSVSGIATLTNATEQHVSFLANPKYRQQLADTNAVAVLVTAEMAENCPVIALVVPDSYAALATLSKSFEYQPTDMSDGSAIAASASIDNSAFLADSVCVGQYVTIGKGVSIGSGTVISPHAVIEDYAVVGKNCHIGASVVIHHHCELGNRVRVHAHVSIGAEGFGFAPVTVKSDAGKTFHWERIAQLGRVMIGDDVRIGANTCIDRGALDDTVIGQGVIIDNLVQIAHNVQIGDYTAIAACTGIAGSTTIGKHCVIGGHVGISGHLTIVDGVTISGGSRILGSIKKPGQYASGTADMPVNQWRRAAVNVKQLAEHAPRKLAAEIKDLKTTLNTLKSRFEQ